MYSKADKDIHLQKIAKMLAEIDKEISIFNANIPQYLGKEQIIYTYRDFKQSKSYVNNKK